MRICTVGDLLLDVVVRIDGPIALDTDTYGQVRVGAGGQAANVAAWAASLGASARFLGKRARDPAGEIAAAELHRRRVEVVGPQVAGRTGTVISIATADGHRAMLSDRGVSPDFAADELDARWLEGCDRLHIPGYSLVRSPLRETALAASRLDMKVSVDASSTTAIEEVGVGRFTESLSSVCPDIVFANEAEAALLLDVRAETVVVKRGDRGCLVRRNGDEHAYRAMVAEVVDGTGAGDAFAAGFLVGGVEVALTAAARCVSRLGAMP